MILGTFLTLIIIIINTVIIDVSIIFILMYSLILIININWKQETQIWKGAGEKPKKEGTISHNCSQSLPLLLKNDKKISLFLFQ